MNHGVRWEGSGEDCIAVSCHKWQVAAMRFAELVELVGDELVFDSSILLAGDVDAGDVRRQLVRWCTAGRVLQLRRSVYALAEPFRKARPHPFVVANALQRGSYVSCESALAFYGLIPEFVATTQSVAAARPQLWETPLGTYQVRHLRAESLFGFETVELGAGQRARVATREKALLDLAHLTAGAERPEYLEGLRLQGLEEVDVDRLRALAGRWGSPKLRRVAARIAGLAEQERQEYGVSR